jgi:hypothetical protein
MLTENMLFLGIGELHFNLIDYEVYSTWIKMLKTLVPHGRTHRLAVVAGMLQYALKQTNLKHNSDNPLCGILEEAVESNNELNEDLLQVIKILFKDAGIKCKHINIRGQV